MYIQLPYNSVNDGSLEHSKQQVIANNEIDISYLTYVTRC
jgi:hypothetical protein